MPRYTLKLTDKDKEYYLLWSSVVDAPLTSGMSYDKYVRWYRYEYGEKALQEWLQGTRNQISEEEVLEYNRAGDNESQLDKEGLLDLYCRTKITCLQCHSTDNVSEETQLCWRCAGMLDNIWCGCGQYLYGTSKIEDNPAIYIPAKTFESMSSFKVIICPKCGKERDIE